MNEPRDPSGTTPDEAELQALSALVDGELSSAAHDEVMDRVGQDADAARRVAAYRAQKNALKSLFATEKTPQYVVLRARVPAWRRLGLAACWLVAGISLGVLCAWIVPRAAPDQASFARRADIAYAVYSPEQRHPVEVAAGQRGHLVTWLSKRLNMPLTIPSLAEYGFSLVGGRLLPGEAGPAAQFMYQNPAGERLTLYMTTVPRKEAPGRILREGDRSTYYWIYDRVGYALSGQIPQAKLQKIAIDVCATLGGRPDMW
jgi:anti-sigma factor RsiW